MSLDVGFWLLIRFFLFTIVPLRFNRRWPSDVRKLNACWTFSGKSTHSSWKIRLLFIIFGTYIQLNRVYICALLSDFLNIFEPRTLRTIDLSDQWPFGLMNLRTKVLESYPGKIANLSQITDKLSHMLYRVHLTITGIQTTTLVVIDTDCTCSCKSNYQTNTTTTAPFKKNSLVPFCHM